LGKLLLGPACGKQSLQSLKAVLSLLSTDTRHQLTCLKLLSNTLYAVPGTKLPRLLPKSLRFQSILLVRLLRGKSLLSAKLLDTKVGREILRTDVVPHLLVRQQCLKTRRLVEAL